VDVIRSEERRRTETPAGVMTTLASPSQGGAAQPIWRVDMQPARSGPLHGIDVEQIWTVLDGSVTVEVAGGEVEIQAGDTVVLPADVPRRLTSGESGLAAIVIAPAGMRAYALDGTQASPTCATPDGDKLIPAWVV
jgi:quercetin dioxygenase-like cupin family protein